MEAHRAWRETAVTAFTKASQPSSSTGSCHSSHQAELPDTLTGYSLQSAPASSLLFQGEPQNTPTSVAASPITQMWMIHPLPSPFQAPPPTLPYSRTTASQPVFPEVLESREPLAKPPSFKCHQGSGVLCTQGPRCYLKRT